MNSRIKVSEKSSCYDLERPSFERIPVNGKVDELRFFMEPFLWGRRKSASSGEVASESEKLLVEPYSVSISVEAIPRLVKKESSDPDEVPLSRLKRAEAGLKRSCPVEAGKKKGIRLDEDPKEKKALIQLSNGQLIRVPRSALQSFHRPPSPSLEPPVASGVVAPLPPSPTVLPSTLIKSSSNPPVVKTPEPLAAPILVNPVSSPSQIIALKNGEKNGSVILLRTATTQRRSSTPGATRVIVAHPPNQQQHHSIQRANLTRVMNRAGTIAPPGFRLPVRAHPPLLPSTPLPLQTPLPKSVVLPKVPVSLSGLDVSKINSWKRPDYSLMSPLSFMPLINGKMPGDIFPQTLQMIKSEESHSTIPSLPVIVSGSHGDTQSMTPVQSELKPPTTTPDADINVSPTRDHDYSYTPRRTDISEESVDKVKACELENPAATVESTSVTEPTSPEELPLNSDQKESPPESVLEKPRLRSETASKRKSSEEELTSLNTQKPSVEGRPSCDTDYLFFVEEGLPKGWYAQKIPKSGKNKNFEIFHFTPDHIRLRPGDDVKKYITSGCSPSGSDRASDARILPKKMPVRRAIVEIRRLLNVDKRSSASVEAQKSAVR